jgi:hypothetical protein
MGPRARASPGVTGESGLGPRLGSRARASSWGHGRVWPGATPGVTGEGQPRPYYIICPAEEEPPWPYALDTPPK